MVAMSVIQDSKTTKKSVVDPAIGAQALASAKKARSKRPTAAETLAQALMAELAPTAAPTTADGWFAQFKREEAQGISLGRGDDERDVRAAFDRLRARTMLTTGAAFLAERMQAPDGLGDLIRDARMADQAREASNLLLDSATIGRRPSREERAVAEKAATWEEEAFEALSAYEPQNWPELIAKTRAMSASQAQFPSSYGCIVVDDMLRLVNDGPKPLVGGPVATAIEAYHAFLPVLADAEAKHTAAEESEDADDAEFEKVDAAWQAARDVRDRLMQRMLSGPVGNMGELFTALTHYVRAGLTYTKGAELEIEDANYAVTKTLTHLRDLLDVDPFDRVDPVWSDAAAAVSDYNRRREEGLSFSDADTDHFLDTLGSLEARNAPTIHHLAWRMRQSLAVECNLDPRHLLGADALAAAEKKNPERSTAFQALRDLDLLVRKALSPANAWSGVDPVYSVVEGEAMIAAREALVEPRMEYRKAEAFLDANPDAKWDNYEQAREAYLDAVDTVLSSPARDLNDALFKITLTREAYPDGQASSVDPDDFCPDAAKTTLAMIRDDLVRLMGPQVDGWNPASHEWEKVAAERLNARDADDETPEATERWKAAEEAYFAVPAPDFSVVLTRLGEDIAIDNGGEGKPLAYTLKSMLQDGDLSEVCRAQTYYDILRLSGGDQRSFDAAAWLTRYDALGLLGLTVHDGCDVITSVEVEAGLSASQRDARARLWLDLNTPARVDAVIECMKANPGKYALIGPEAICRAWDGAKAAQIAAE